VKRDLHRETINIIIGTLIDCDQQTLSKIYGLTSIINTVLTPRTIETAISTVIPNRLVNTHTHACIIHAARVFWQEFTNQQTLPYKPTGE
jgi:hypothetical protein